MYIKAKKLAKKIFGSKNIKSIENNTMGFEKRYKIVVFVPQEKTDDLIFAMASAGAGEIGNYKLCSFRTIGTGTFMGNENSDPLIGIRGEFEKADEIRLEMICDEQNINHVIEKLYSVHPYDEPAFEIYTVLTRNRKQNNEIVSVLLKKKLSVKRLMKMINPQIDTSYIPGKLMKIKVGKSIVDCSENEEINIEEHKEKLLYIKKYNNNIKAYLT